MSLSHHLCPHESTYGLHSKSANWSMLFRFFRPENCCIKGGPPTRYKAHLLIHRIRCNKQLVHSEEAISANLSCSFSLWGSDEHRCNECFCWFHCDIHTVQSCRRVQEYRTYSADLDFTRSQVSYEINRQSRTMRHLDLQLIVGRRNEVGLTATAFKAGCGRHRLMQLLGTG